MKNSYLFVPGNQPDRITKALASQADVVIIDLEDAVPLNNKNNVRELVYEYLTASNLQVTENICVRINDRSSPHYEEDVKMVAKIPELTIMLPKASSPADIHLLEEKVAANQLIIPLIETAQGVLSAYDIARSSPSITKLAFGAVDYCLDLDILISNHGQELIYPRSSLVLASRAAGLEAPIDTVYTDISNEDGLIKEIQRAKNLGLFSKLCIHPNQLKHVNTLFGPSPEELKWAEKVVKSFEQVLDEGLSAILIDNQMIDLPGYKKALATLKNTR